MATPVSLKGALEGSVSAKMLYFSVSVLSAHCLLEITLIADWRQLFTLNNVPDRQFYKDAAPSYRFHSMCFTKDLKLVKNYKFDVVFL